MHHLANRDDGDVLAFANHIRFAERDRIGLVGNLGFVVVHCLVLEIDDGIVVADGLDQQPLGVIGVGGNDHLHAGHMGEERIERLAVLGRSPQARAVHRPDDQRGFRLAAEHVAELSRLVVDRVETDPEEVDEHQLDDGAHAGDCGAGRRTEETAFRDRRVQNPRRSELGMKPLGHAQRAAPGIVLAGCAGAAGHILAHHDDRGVAAHLDRHRLVDGGPVRFPRHYQSSRSVRAVNVGHEIGLGGTRRDLRG